MSNSRRSEPREARELPRGNAPMAPGAWHPSATAPRPNCGCGDRATALVFDKRGDYWTCGRSKCAPVYVGRSER